MYNNNLIMPILQMCLLFKNNRVPICVDNFVFVMLNMCAQNFSVVFTHNLTIEFDPEGHIISYLIVESAAKLVQKLVWF